MKGKALQVVGFGEPLEWREIEVSDPVGSQVILEVTHCGVCHSDLHLWEGYYDLGGGDRFYVSERGIEPPFTMGHEVVGRVVAVGPEVASVQIGDERLVYPWMGCDDCEYCAEGSQNLCSSPRSLGVFGDGGYAELVEVPHDKYLIDFGKLAPEQACSYACAGLTAYSALRKLPKAKSGQWLFIIGAGGLGLMALSIVSYLWSGKVIIGDLSDAKLAAAREIDGDVTTINTSATEMAKRIKELTGGDGVHGVVDFVNNTPTAALAQATLAKNGAHIMVGLFGGKLEMNTPTLPFRNTRIVGSYTGTLPELQELVELANLDQTPKLPVACHPMDDALDILDRIKAGSVIGRAVLQRG